MNHKSGITTYQTFGNLQSTDYGKLIYANTNYGLLGLVIEEVTGVPYSEYMSKNIFNPLGMKNTAATLKESQENGLVKGFQNYFGIPVAMESNYQEEITQDAWSTVSAGYITSSLADMEKYMQMYLKGGYNIVSQESIHQMFFGNQESGIYDTTTYDRPVIRMAGLVENFMSYTFIIPDKEISVIVLVNMNDYLVTNSVIGYIILPLLEQEQKALPNLYLILHGIINLICLILIVISVYPLVTIKKWKTTKEGNRYFVDVLRHAVLPFALLAIPFAMGVPYKILWLYVRDITLVIIFNASLLLLVGLYKMFYVLNTKIKHTPHNPITQGAPHDPTT